MLPLQGNLLVESEEQIAEDILVALNFMKELNSKLIQSEDKRKMLRQKLQKLRDIVSEEEKLLEKLKEKKAKESPVKKQVEEIKEEEEEERVEEVVEIVEEIEEEVEVELEDEEPGEQVREEEKEASKPTKSLTASPLRPSPRRTQD